MPATEAQIRANQANADRSTGPKTEEGKARSRRNALKHGLTGDGVVMPEEDAAEVERLARALRDEMKPPGEVGELLVRRIATFSVRMDRSFDQETAALSRRARQAMDDFEAPEGVDAETASKLRVEAGKIALFDPSKEATLARRYEAIATRGFFQAIKELRQLNKESTASPAEDFATQARSTVVQLGSIFPAKPKPQANVPTPPPAPSKPPTNSPQFPENILGKVADEVDYVAFAIGKPR